MRARAAAIGTHPWLGSGPRAGPRCRDGLAGFRVAAWSYPRGLPAQFFAALYSACQLIFSPSARLTFRIVPNVGLPSGESARYSASRAKPEARATCIIP